MVDVCRARRCTGEVCRAGGGRMSGRPPDETLTPAMRQYWEQKEQAGDALLRFRMGDF